MFNFEKGNTADDLFYRRYHGKLLHHEGVPRMGKGNGNSRMP